MNPRIKAYTLLNQTADAMETVTRRELSQYGLNCNEYAILELLYGSGDQTIHQLGKEIMVTSGSMTYLIDKLEKRGYIRRDPSPDDRRVIFVVITAAGRELLGQVLPSYQAKVEEVFSCFTDEEAQSIIELMEKAKQHAQST